MRSLKDDEIRWIGGGYPPTGSDDQDGWDTNPWFPPPPPPVYSEGPDVGGGNSPPPPPNPHWVADQTNGNRTVGAQEQAVLAVAWDAYQSAGAGTAEERLYNWEVNHPGFGNQDWGFWASLSDFQDGSQFNGDTGADPNGDHYSLQHV
jgi:hypothetical protein